MRGMFRFWICNRKGCRCIKVFYCFHQDNDDSKCEVALTSLSIRPSKKSGRLVVPEPGGDTWHLNHLGSYLPSGWR